METKSETTKGRDSVRFDTIVKWRPVNDPPKETGWYAVSNDDEWRRDFWMGDRWFNHDGYNKYWAEIIPPQAT